jgi:hypothetical protein
VQETQSRVDKENSGIRSLKIHKNLLLDTIQRIGHNHLSFDRIKWIMGIKIVIAIVLGYYA